MAVMSDFDAAFLDDDHRFHVGYLTEERADLEAAEALGLLELTGPSTIIDAGCGDGRLAVRLASLGHRVVAIDIDPDQVERAQAAAERRGVELDLRSADLCHEVVRPPADGALMWFTTYGFLSDADNLRVLCNLREGLRSGARLVIDTLDPAAVSAELAGFCPVTTKPSVTTWGAQSGPDEYRPPTARRRASRVLSGPPMRATLSTARSSASEKPVRRLPLTKRAAVSSDATSAMTPWQTLATGARPASAMATRKDATDGSVARSATAPWPPATKTTSTAAGSRSEIFVDSASSFLVSSPSSNRLAADV